MTDIDQGHTLLTIARSAIAGHLGLPEATVHGADWLDRPGATFVTLTEHGGLRGCIGSLEARRPLRDDVHDNAISAAFRDPRFNPVRAEEFSDVRVEVSLLTPAQPIEFLDEEDAVSQLNPGIDGVIMEYGAHRGTFLPQVWEQLPDPNEFMMHLKHKAGLPVDFWSASLRLSRYAVQKWKE